jgi:VWFA-related protein
MKKKSLITALVLILLAGSVATASAQGVVSLSIDELNLDQHPQVTTRVTVRNENGVPIPNLGADKFEIVEDGRASFPPAEVSAVVNPEAVVSVMMVIDISGSMEGTPIKEAMHAANALIDQLSPQDRVGLIAFADQIDLSLDTPLAEGREIGFTTDKNAVRNVVNFLDTKIGWDTPLYDAIYKGVKLTANEPVGKRALIVMTDGRDEKDNAQGVPVKDAGSLSSPDDPINEANRHNIPIFPIGLVGLGGKIDTKYLQRLAERTGGVYQEAPAPEELTPLFENVMNQLKQQYVLTYNSTLEKDTNPHSLLVRVQLPQGQAFAERKFRFFAEVEPTVPPTEPPSGSPTEPVSTPEVNPVEDPAPTVVAQVANTPPPAQPPAATPEPSGFQGIVNTIRDTIQQQPLLAAAIGGGILLLLILIIALIVVLAKGRGGDEEEFYSAGYDQAQAPPPAWMSDRTAPEMPARESPTMGKTEMAAPDWAGPSAGPPPFAPAAPADSIPETGSTRIIERAPKHLAMLVDKAHPDRKYDLKGVTNVGRGKENQIVLEDPTISRNHAWIKVQGEDFLVFDIGSANGTFVNGERVEAPRPLNNGDTVRFGEADFVFTKVF